MAPKMGPQMAPNRFKMGHDGELGAEESLIGHGSAYGLQSLAEDAFFENLPMRKVYKFIGKLQLRGKGWVVVYKDSAVERRAGVSKRMPLRRALLLPQ